MVSQEGKNVTKTAAKPVGKDLEAFRASHDKSYIVPRRIREALVALGDSWEYEGEFMKRCNLSSTDFAAYRDQFREFYVETAGGGGNRGKRVWAGSKVFAGKLKDTMS